MHILIFGGNGRTGRLVIAAALENGHTATALVRDPSSLPARKGLTIKQGTPLNRTDIAASLSTPTGAALPDAVIITLNAPRASDSPFAAPIAPPRMMADAAANVAAAVRERAGADGAALPRVVTLSAFGVADSAPNLSWPFRLVLRRTNMVHQFADHDLVDAETKARKDVPYVLVRPAMLAEGPAAAVKVWGDQGEGAPCFGKVTRASVARFLVEVAESETGEWVGRTPVITN
ncbi:uncharacterized protein K452DRAFT_274196 [Aplosporella prunicola CBS 121167]|uniref:NAD(P)-binding domain-containing protein n=1 Tax=Aplosporella prunicola CBS 121167 TaxID=1176127 RepID=A0A6A6BBX5_9PEZI|nr:uncharacterized protein K452DRAFT_274196 [Aplosporella prunicola CBS 121167]KAF2140417.1 hypothetical protein K452DRAFT_274196 [Aplosporella prunicola CBS 121167]